VGDVMLTKSHATLGTVSYMAPEQVRGEQLDGRADLWALGVLLYEMLTARRPFEGEHEVAIAHAIVHSNPVRPSALRSEVPRELDAFVLALLSREPRSRPATAEIVAADLTALQSLSPRKVRRWRPTFADGERRRAIAWAATVAVVVAAAGATTWLLRAPPSSSSSAPRIVAVLPFENIGGREDTDHFVVALPDEIATRLSQLSGITITREGLALKYRGSAKPTSAVAGELGADAVIRGSVRRTGDEMRLQVELFDAREKRRVWTHEYVGPVNTVLALQRSAAKGIVDALDLGMTRAERAVLEQAPTTSAEAYDLYLRGKAAQIAAATNDSSQRLEALQRAQSFYARARETDPGFAAARASLAMSHLGLATNDRTGARRGQARLEAEAALRLQSGNSEAHEALASYWLLEEEPVKAIDELERALAGRPNAAHLHARLGTSLRQAGRWEESVISLERASRLDPRNSRLHLTAALTYSRMRRYDEAIAHWDRMIAMDSTGDPFPRIIRGFAYLRRGNVDSLDAAIRRIPLGADRGGMTPDAQGMTTYAHYTAHRMSGRHGEALASLDSARFAIVADGLMYLPVTLMRAQTLELMGDAARARSAYEATKAVLEDSVAAHPRDARMRIALGLAYAGLQRRAAAMREARTATELVPLSQGIENSTAFMGGVVEIYARVGEADAALELIELLLSMPAGREISVPLLQLDPAFNRLRSDPRFEALLGRFTKN